MRRMVRLRSPGSFTALSTLTLLLALAGCSRGFSAPSTASRSDGIFLNGNGPLLDAAPIAAEGTDGNPITLEIRGASLSLIRSVLVDGAPAQVVASTDTAIDFLAPDVSQVQVGVPVSITLSDANGERSAGRLRFYVPPEMDSLPTPVVAPGQVVVSGSGFSPVAEENQISVDGASANSQPTVVVAAADHLLVTLPAGLPEGRTLFTLRIVPKGGQLDRPLTYARRPLIWKVIPAFWNDPPQAFSNTEVRFRPPKADGGTLYDDLDDILTQQQALGSLDVPVVAAAINAGTDTGTANGTTGPSAGAATGGTSGAATTGSSGSIGTSGVGNTTGTGSPSGIDLDAGAIAANYPPDDSDAGDFVPPTQDLPLSTSGEVLAHSGLSVARDGIDTGATPLINLDTNELSWVVPEGTPTGSHLIALFNPAGTSPYAPLTILPGHLAAPSLSCYPLGSGTALPPMPRAMHSHDTQGEVLLPTLDNAGGLSLTVIHPGGAVETQPVPHSTNAALVLAGRDLLYVINTLSDGGARLSTTDGAADGGPFIQQGDALGQVWDVLEPNSRELFTWTLFSGSPPVLMSWDGNQVQLQNDGSSFDCPVMSGALDPAHVTLASICQGDFWIGQADVPTAIGDGATTVSWTDTGVPTHSSAASVQALPGGAMLFQDGASVQAAQLYDPGLGTGLQVATGKVASVAATALARSPDGLQVLLGHDSEVDIALTSDFQSWESQGGFSLPGKARAITYDASGSQGVVLYDDPDGGSGYCELH